MNAVQPMHAKYNAGGPNIGTKAIVRIAKKINKRICLH
jgi:hypothetical protein